ncbi:glycosyl hydrolase family 18 protein [Cohnella sp. GCM10027633]|uniref:glycosyl hydrolase family 18 protein n=1 Tax=unclassified Cohnella TaxID=2636738 RepID=UPI00362E7A2C
MWKKASLIGCALTVLMTGRAYAYDAQLQPFKDEQNDYSREPIYTLSALGIIDGYEDRTYRPNIDLSREAFVKLLVMASRIDTGTARAKTPTDVAATRWSAPYIAAAFERHWIDSLLDKKGQFLPARTITRQEVAMLVGRSLLDQESAEARKQWLEAEWKKERDERAFKDGSSIDAAMQPYVYYAARRGIMEGDQTGFKPKEPLIRKQAAAVVYRMIDKLVSEESVDFTGYYAIESYPALHQIDKLSNVILGWSRLAYSGSGTAKLDVSTPVHYVPPGYEEVTAAADAAGIPKELMVFYEKSDLKDFLKDQHAQQAFVDSLLTTLNDPAYDFIGVSIDFEGLREAASAPDYIRFLQALKERLGTLSLSVAVPPTDYYKGYDLAAIGKLADTVVLMAYDFTHDVGKLPSAPLPLVNETVLEALQAIPKEKLVLGISKQANQWITAGGATGPALSPEIAAVERRLAMPGVAKTREMPYFLGKATYVSELGSNVLYYEDTASIAKKLWLAKFYELKGVSLWFMGNFTAADWELVGQQSARGRQAP